MIAHPGDSVSESTWQPVADFQLRDYLPPIVSGTSSTTLRYIGLVAAQTTSQVTLDQFPNFIDGIDVQLFVQTHGTVSFLIGRCLSIGCFALS